MSELVDQVLTATRLGPVDVRNRVVKAATFETMSPGGQVTDELIAWHVEFARGGVGMTTLAYCAVGQEGLTFRDQITMTPHMLKPLSRFTDAIHDEGAAAAIQLGHAGWFANPKAAGGRPIGPSAKFSPKSQARSRAFGPEDFVRAREQHAEAAGIAVDAGFDAIEVHVGHGYLLSQFLSPYNNKRRDEYGGSIENRARFPREVLKAVHDAVAGKAAVTAKLNMSDGFSGGLTVDESVQVARWLVEDGSVDAIQLTGGHTTRSPMFLMRGETPVKDMASVEKTAARRAFMRAGMSVYIRDFPFEEAYFLPLAQRFLGSVDVPLMLLGGITRLDTMADAMHRGFGFVALGRGLIRQPDLVKKMLSGETDRSPCVPCNRCIAKVGHEPTRCVFR